MAKKNVVKLKIDQEVKGKENVDELTVSLNSLKECVKKNYLLIIAFEY